MDEQKTLKQIPAYLEIFFILEAKLIRMKNTGQPLSNAQLEILKAFSHQLSNSELEEFRDVIAQYFGKRAIQAADKVWDEKGLTEKDVEIMLSTKMRVNQ